MPSGASPGVLEACELRDGNPQEFNGMGVLNAVRNVKEIIGPALIKKNFLVTQQKEIDNFMVKELDGTPNKSKGPVNIPPLFIWISEISIFICKVDWVQMRYSVFPWLCSRPELLRRYCLTCTIDHDTATI